MVEPREFLVLVTALKDGHITSSIHVNLALDNHFLKWKHKHD